MPRSYKNILLTDKSSWSSKLAAGTIRYYLALIKKIAIFVDNWRYLLELQGETLAGSRIFCCTRREAGESVMQFHENLCES